MSEPIKLETKVKERAKKVGFELSDTSRSGTFFQSDQTVMGAMTHKGGVVVMSIKEAMKKYDWLKDYWWKAVDRKKDEYTKIADVEEADGYFIYAPKGVKTDYPVEACLYIEKDGSTQKVHNIIIAEEGAELHIITGCTSGHEVNTGLHVGVSEFFVKKGGKISFTMIHSWAPEIEVKPRTGILVEEDGVYMSNYVTMNPVKDLQTYPVCRLGKNATARFNSILWATPGSYMNVGSKVILEGEGSRAEIIARTISNGGTIINPGSMEGLAPGVKGHLECRGLILGDKGRIHAVPEIDARLDDVDLSHEAAVGKIAEEEIQYLQARGLTSDEATAAIVRGFLDIEIKGLPEMLKNEIKKATDLSQMGS